LSQRAFGKDESGKTGAGLREEKLDLLCIYLD